MHRQLVGVVGVGPLALARAQRAQTARVLLETTALPVAEVALAAGFGSVRQFNATVKEVFALTPGALRDRARRGGLTVDSGAIALRLPYRAPFDADGLLAFLAPRSVPGSRKWSIGSTDAACACRTAPASSSSSLPKGTSAPATRWTI